MTASPSRTTTPLRAMPAQPPVAPLGRIWLRLQDLAFEALSELRFGLDKLIAAAEHDDRESAIERGVFEDMERCACACCRLHLPRLLEADRHDKRERHQGWALAAVRVSASAEYIRGGSTEIEAGRVLAFGKKGGGR